MKDIQLRPSCANRIPTFSSPPATDAVAANVSSRRAPVRLRDKTMKTQVQSTGHGPSAWDPRSLWVALRGLLKREQSECRSTISDGRERAGVFPAFSLKPAVAIPLGTHRLSPTRIDRGQVLRSNSGLHLWLVLRSEEHRGGAFWETACFLAIWLAGILGVAICVL